MQQDDEQTEYIVLYHGAAGDYEFEDDETSEHIKLTWWQRRRLAKEIKREQRAERKADKALTKRLMKAARDTIKANKRAQKASAKAEAAGLKQKLTEPALYRAGTTLTECAQYDTMQGRRLAADSIVRAFTAMRDRRFKYVAAFGTWITMLACVFMLTMCGACSMHTGTLRPTQPGVAVDKNAVLITTWCVDASKMAAGEVKLELGGMGSGVLTDRTTVMTAGHVVSCDEKQEVAAVLVYTFDGAMHGALGSTKPDHDTVMLLLKDPVTFDVVPVRFGKRPSIGERVCMSSMHPNYQRSCGVVQAYRDTPVGDTRISMPAVPGNSGSALYDSTGALVGIVVQREPCGKKFPLDRASCGGYASTVLP